MSSYSNDWSLISLQSFEDLFNPSVGTPSKRIEQHCRHQNPAFNSNDLVGACFLGKIFVAHAFRQCTETRYRFYAYSEESVRQFLSRHNTQGTSDQGHFEIPSMVLVGRQRAIVLFEDTNSYSSAGNFAPFSSSKTGPTIGNQKHSSRFLNSSSLHGLSLPTRESHLLRDFRLAVGTTTGPMNRWRALGGRDGSSISHTFVTQLS